MMEAKPERGELVTDLVASWTMPPNKRLSRYDSRSTNFADQPQHLALQSKIVFRELNSGAGIRREMQIVGGPTAGRRIRAESP